MRSQHRGSLLTLAAAGVLLFSLMHPTLALADDSTPPPAETQEVEIPPETGADTEGAPASQVVEESTPAPESEDLTAAEALKQAPEGTEVIVVNDDGQMEPLATQNAVELVSSGDPLWCPVGSTPQAGAGGCSDPGAGNSNYDPTSLQSLLTYLDANEPASAGVIWIEDSYDSSVNDAAAAGFAIDGASFATMKDHDLTLQGGWDGGTAGTISGASSFTNDYLHITNWNANVFVNAIQVTGATGSSASLQAETSGDVNLDNVTVTGNTSGSGADLDSCIYDNATGLCTGTGSVTVDDSQFNNNAFNGLVADSAGDTTLTNVQANNNSLNGAQITGADDDGTGDVSIQNSQFNNNANGTGLDVLSDGNIDLDNVTADSNYTGINLDATAGSGTVTVHNGSQASDNAGTGLHTKSKGDITVSQFTAERNAANGAYLAAYDLANITVDTNSYFEQNGNYGIFSKTCGGDITLDTIEVHGNSTTQTGAFLKTCGGGNVQVDSSDFHDNLHSGLVVVSSGQVDLNIVNAYNNGKHGTEVYSTYTYTCRGENNITVNVDAGTFLNNLLYGLKVVPGAGGTLTFVNPATFTGNGSGDYLLVLEDPSCAKHVKATPKPPKVVEVPFSDGPTVDQDCEQYSGTILKLPNGTAVKVGCPYTGGTLLEGVGEDSLPGPLGAGASFLEGISVSFTNEGQPIEQLTEGGLLTLAFEVPEDSRARRFSILFWDPTANDGQGAWIQLPPYEFNTTFKLHPDDPDDGRMITSGVRLNSNSVTATVNFPGIFVLSTE